MKEKAESIVHQISKCFDCPSLRVYDSAIAHDTSDKVTLRSYKTSNALTLYKSYRSSAKRFDREGSIMHLGNSNYKHNVSSHNQGGATFKLTQVETQEVQEKPEPTMCELFDSVVAVENINK